MVIVEMVNVVTGQRVEKFKGEAIEDTFREVQGLMHSLWADYSRKDWEIRIRREDAGEGSE